MGSCTREVGEYGKLHGGGRNIWEAARGKGGVYGNLQNGKVGVYRKLGVYWKLHSMEDRNILEAYGEGVGGGVIETELQWETNWLEGREKGRRGVCSITF